MTAAAAVAVRPALTFPLDATHPEWAAYLDACRWGYAGGPRPTFRGYLIEHEALAVHRERTGRGDPWPSLEDYAEAARRVDASAPSSSTCPLHGAGCEAWT